jgi:tetratricopeptide (TPR) repeat protein
LLLPSIGIDPGDVGLRPWEAIMIVDSKSKLLRDAERYVLQGKIPQAIAEYLKLVKNDPNDVLTLNTVGDLHLRLGKAAEASRYFNQVAENYSRNNFLLKAIAVYKKILNVDPQNLEVNQTLADLFARQGLNGDARNQYLRVAEICTRDGKIRESLDAYEKAVEMDPANTAVQLKLAEVFLAEGLKDKAQCYFAGAARAQAKSGNHTAAVLTFKRVVDLNPADVDSLKGLLNSAIHSAEVPSVIEQLKKSLGIIPDSVDVRELLGRAYLAVGNPTSAAQAFEMAVALDETRYEGLFDLADGFVQAGNLDGAATCLDPIIPRLISTRKTDRAVECYQLVLQKNPSHMLALGKLADIFSAINDQARYVECLERIAETHTRGGSPAEAIGALEKIVQIMPDSEKYLQLHREAFEAAFPGAPYTPPALPVERRREAGPAREDAGDPEGADADGQASGSKFIEVDLLLNYGMMEKAAEMLQGLAAKDACDKHVHARLVTVYTATADTHQAAVHTVLLAALERHANNEVAAQRHLAEARRLDSGLVDDTFDLVAFAAQYGVDARPSDTAGSRSGLELDLSGDLSDIFFKDGGEASLREDADPATAGDPAAEEYSAEVPPPRFTAESLQDQLQEVDFYIRLGFADEARTKLDEIARRNPDHPDLAARYSQLESVNPVSAPQAGANPGPKCGRDTSETDAEENIVIALGNGASPDSRDWLEAEMEPEIKRAPRSGGSVIEFPGAPDPGSRHHPETAAPGGRNGQFNAMFADLIDEVNALTDQEITREDFETHFNLGIAYREMALIDDAINEFQAAMKSLQQEKYSKEAIQCCGMLSTCYLEKGMPRSAIRWCQTGLNLKEISSHEALALRYDMGVAHSVTGDSERALECFGLIFSVDPSYRDVAQRIDDLRGSSGRHVP